MNIFAVLIGVAGIVYIVNKVYRSPKVVFTESDNQYSSSLTDVKAEVLLQIRAEKGEQLVLQESATLGDVIVKAKDASGEYKALGVLHDVELYKKVQQKRARAKIASVNGAEVIVEYSFS